MSIFSSIAHEIGHTAESLAHEVGAGVGELEGLVVELGADSIDVFFNAARLGLSPVSFLRSMLKLLHGDPHQLLLNHLVAPFKPVEEPLYMLSSQWNQLAILHENTAQQIHMHITDLFQGGDFSYSGPAADTLWNTHQDLQQYSTTLTDHAQTQQGRYATLNGHFSDFLGQAPGKVYSLSAPMAALGVLSYETLVTAPPPVLDEAAVEAIIAAMETDLAFGTAGPEIWPIILVVLVILVVILVVVVIVIIIKDAIESHQRAQKSTRVPKPSPGPSPIPPNPGLTPEQQRIHEDVKKLLQGSIYNDWEIEQLILAGYTTPTTIVAIIKRGSTFYALFNDSKTAALMNELTSAQQLQFINNVALYQATHPGLPSHQVYNALRYIKLKAQLNLLLADTTKETRDPISQAIAHAFPTQTQAFHDRLYQDAGNPIDRVTDPFTVTDKDLTGWYSNLTGKWGEWASIKQYMQQGKLVDFSVILPNPTGAVDGEVDIKIREGGVVKWVEVKNVETPARQWGKALTQAIKYVQHGATYVIIQLPQQEVEGVNSVQPQQLNNLEQLKRRYPNVTFEVRTGASDPGIRIPFDPPSTNWGSYLP
ncbi:hypothetical protein ccbrp13_33710 [Ktedonobacteria bacterium brp13]|nr:hypothetical protein ccbrp13_33710 [Ktedonobacteria bacterium brp13]